MTVLLEREGELSSLAAALERAKAGQGSVVLVAGEAGIGNAPLARRSLRRTTWRGTRAPEFARSLLDVLRVAARRMSRVPGFSF